MFNWRELFSDMPSVITVVGMAKNSGKTVAMNYLQRMLHREGRKLALFSIGLDGERFDALTRLPKPSVVVQPGTLVATAEKFIDSRQQWDRLRSTAIHTPVGQIIVLRARAEQAVVLAGPSKNADARAVLGELTASGADCVLIDGAFDRQSSADPTVSGQVILASGATLSRDISCLVAVTKSRVEQLSLPVCEGEYSRLSAATPAKIKLVSGSRVNNLDVATTLLSADEWAGILAGGCDAVVLEGAAGEGLGEALLKAAKPPAVIVRDGSKVFLPACLWSRLRRRGVTFRALKPIRLLAVTVNPVVPGGAGVDPVDLLAAMGSALFPLPVIDVVREAKYTEP